MAVRDFTLNVAEGEFVSIIGHSGCGKSTILKSLLGFIKPSGGEMRVLGSGDLSVAMRASEPGWSAALTRSRPTRLVFLPCRIKIAKGRWVTTFGGAVCCQG